MFDLFNVTKPVEITSQQGAALYYAASYGHTFSVY
jgi:hypothetical protein